MTRIRRATARSLLAVIAAAGITLPALILISCTGPSSQSNPQVRPHVPTAGETRAETAPERREALRYARAVCAF